MDLWTCATVQRMSILHVGHPCRREMFAQFQFSVRTDTFQRRWRIETKSQPQWDQQPHTTRTFGHASQIVTPMPRGEGNINIIVPPQINGCYWASCFKYRKGCLCALDLALSYPSDVLLLSCGLAPPVVLRALWPCCRPGVSCPVSSSCPPRVLWPHLQTLGHQQFASEAAKQQEDNSHTTDGQKGQVTREGKQLDSGFTGAARDCGQCFFLRQTYTVWGKFSCNLCPACL